MATEYLRQRQIPHSTADSAARQCVAALAALLLAACSSSSGGGGSPAPTPAPAPTNNAPTAVAGPDMAVSATIPVQLDGSASSDADGDAITYAWSFAFVPSGSSATFDDATAAQPSFTPDVAGDYTIELVVSDGTATSSTDEVVVTAGDNTVTQSIGAAGGRIASSDGLLTLEVPAGALMSDTDISVTFVTDDQRDSYLGPEFDDLESMQSVYDLGPDGQTFAVPITVTVDTGDNPVIDANTIGGIMRYLLTSDAGASSVLSDLQINADADTMSVTLSGTLDHFSPIVFDPKWVATPGIRWQISGVPDRIAPEQTVVVSAEVESSRLALERAFYEDIYLIPAFILREVPAVRTMARQGNTDTFSMDAEYDCTSAGAGTSRDYVGYIEFRVENPVDDVDHHDLGVWGRKKVECVNATPPPPPPSPEVTPGIFPAPGGLTLLEALQTGSLLGLIPLAPPSSPSTKPTTSNSHGQPANSAAEAAADVSNDPMALFAGAEGNVLVNLLTNEVIRDATDPASTNPAFGAVLASSILPDGTPAGMIYEFGAGTFGGLRCDYDPATESFGTFCLTQVGTIYDAVPLGNTHETTQVSFATNFGVGVFELDLNTGIYEGSSDFDTGTNAFSGTPFSAVRGALAGPLLVISNRAPDYTALSLVDPDGTVTDIEFFFGEDGRKLRCVGTLCAISVFNDGNGGALRFVTWDGINAPTIVDATVTVGDGPVGHDGILLTNGNVLWVSTGFNDNTVTLTEVTSTGDLVSSNTDPVPNGCLQPGHADWYIPDGVPEEAQLVGTCYDSNQYYVLDIVLDPTDGFRIVPLE